MKQSLLFVHGGNAFSKYEDYLLYLKTAKLWNVPGVVPKDVFSKSLATDLESTHVVISPTMPNKQNAQFSEWVVWFERHFQYLVPGDVTLVGWSLGGLFLAKYLALYNPPFTISTVHLLAAPFLGTDDVNGEDCGTFRMTQEECQNLQKYAVHLWHATDDQIVPYDHAIQYAKILPQATLHTFSDKGHFVVSDFPELLASLRAESSITR